MTAGFSGIDLIQTWLQPLDGESGACGPDLGYDNDFLALTKAALGKPETQFEAATPPDWRQVRQMAEALMARSRDLRIAMLWLRACVNLEGFVALPPALGLLHGLLDQFWDGLHPLPDPDDNDPYARMNNLAELPQQSTVLGDVRRCVLFTARGLGDIRVRHVEVMLGLVAARDDEQTFTREQLSQMLKAALVDRPDLRLLPAQAMQALKDLSALAADRAGTPNAPDLKPLQGVLHQLNAVMPVEAQEEAPSPPDAIPAVPAEAGPMLVAARKQAAGAPTMAGLSGGVHSRDDALRAIDMVCDYLERHEPTNPAPLLLRRARRIISHNFLQLMKELAPESLAEVARIMGVDPESVQVDPP